ncbi:MAG TPA: hypothetical protein DDZ60_10380 [Planktothrix sp. UBA10369]|jgi:hypothetical protein|nr:hypothetical protein [Planktothrix sp. UBA8402]HBK22882.1 hypothetical protein [Planktothrix sp. UBA10369]
MKLTTQPDDIAYLAALILRLNGIPDHTSKEVDFTKSLILITSGVLVGSNLNGELTPSKFDGILNDYIENFQQLYPQYFQAVHPVFQQMVLTISKEKSCLIT